VKVAAIDGTGRERADAAVRAGDHDSGGGRYDLTFTQPSQPVVLKSLDSSAQTVIGGRARHHGREGHDTRLRPDKYGSATSTAIGRSDISTRASR